MVAAEVAAQPHERGSCGRWQAFDRCPLHLYAVFLWEEFEHVWVDEENWCVAEDMIPSLQCSIRHQPNASTRKLFDFVRRIGLLIDVAAECTRVGERW